MTPPERAPVGVPAQGFWGRIWWSRLALFVALAGIEPSCATVPPRPPAESRAVVLVPPAARGDKAGEPEALAAPGGPCKRQLMVEQLTRADDCLTDERMRDSGVLEFSCGGGAAEARFQDAVFKGSLREGRLELRLQHRFRHQDGCEWRSTQQLFGSLADTTLHYSYDDEPLPGQTDCASPCGATAVVRMLERPSG